ncbi:MAG: T9SS type A sorting domain-containing protein, partial [Bacteroidota bacterium]
SSFKQTGFAGSLQGTQIPVIYSPADEIYQFPLNFNNSFVTNSAYSFQLPTIASFFQDRTRTTTVDGWGTLTLPGGLTYQVLRVKSDIADDDSIYVDAFGFGTTIPRLTHEYKWIAVNKGLPMLQINTNDVFGTETVSSVSYQDFQTSGVTDLQTNENSFQLYPNPTSDFVYVLPFEKFHNEKMLITDVEGKLLSEIPVSNSVTTVIDLTHFSEGIYFVQFTSDGKSASVQKLIVNR